MSDTTDLLTVAEVAAQMRVSKMTVYRLIHNGELSALRVGRSLRVPGKAVAVYLSAAHVETACVQTRNEAGAPSR